MGVLQHDPKRVAQVIFFDLVDIDAVIADLAVLNIVETVDQVGNGRLSGTGAADKGNFLTRRSVEIYVVKNGLLRNLAEIDIIKYHVAF